MRFFINPLKALLCLVVAAIFLILFVTSLPAGMLVLAVIYFLLCILYIGLTCHYATILEMNDEGLRNRFLLWTYNELPWSEVREVGIANLKVINNAEKKKVGELYLYFSREVMTEDEQLGMCLHWPPKDKRYMSYSPSRQKAIRRYWGESPALAWITKEALENRYNRK